MQVKLLALKTKKGKLISMEAAEARRDQTTGYKGQICEETVVLRRWKSTKM